MSMCPLTAATTEVVKKVGEGDQSPEESSDEGFSGPDLASGSESEVEKQEQPEDEESESSDSDVELVKKDTSLF